VKLEWGSETRNTTDDVVATLRRLEERRAGFLLWTYETLFRADEGRYDTDRVLEAMGGDPAVMRPYRRAGPRAAPPSGTAHGSQWTYFDSRETATGPLLVVTGAGGEERTFPAQADSVLISYLAENAFGSHARLSINLGDLNRVLLRFDVAGAEGVARAELRLRNHLSRIPPTAPFEIGLHEVTDTWDERTASWKAPPPFLEEPTLRAEIPAAEAEVRVDVTALVRAWLQDPANNHGLLLKVTRALPTPAVAPARSPSGAGGTPWTQPPIRTGTPFTEDLPWAATIEEALERSRAENKVVLATVVAVQDRRWSSGYAAAPRDWAGTTPHPWGDDRMMAIDAGLVKERAMMLALFSDPEAAHLVRSHFVPVRVRLHTYLLDPGLGDARTADPLAALGADARALGAPALAFARPDGKARHACGRMGVLSAPMFRAMLRAVLREAGVRKPAPFEPASSSDLAEARRLAGLGRLDDALAAIGKVRLEEDSPLRDEARYLEARLRDGLGQTDRATALLQAVARDDPDGAWGGRAAARLEPRGVRPDEWEDLRDLAFEPLSTGTETEVPATGIEEAMARAVDLLLRHQRPEGGWPDPFYDVHPAAGPGSPYDKEVARTGLVVDALMKMRPRLPKRRVEIDDAIRRGVERVGRFADAPEPHVWQLTYALHLQVAILSSDLELDKTQARARARRLLEALAGIQQEGGWSYMPLPRTHSFNTAPVLLLLAALRDLRVAAPGEMGDRAAGFLESLREPNERRDFAYASNVHHKSVRGSSCRTALCELALLSWRGGKDVSDLSAGVDLFFEHDEAVRTTTKIYESYFSPAAMHDAYHYYFGHWYTARALDRLPAKEAKRWARRQIDILRRQVEWDGSFVDAQMQGRCTSTALALLTLLEDLRH